MSNSSRRFRVAILVSGNGSNMEALIEAAKKGILTRVQIGLVLTNKVDAGALFKARSHGIPTKIIDSKAYAKAEDKFQTEVLGALEDSRIDIVCLAGYLKKVGPTIVNRYRGRILNIHPALLPKYGGAGMYGHFVHEAVLKAGDKETGCSVHIVDDEFDHGAVLAQVRVPVMKGDNPDKLAARVLEQEHKLYPKVLEKFCDQLVAAGRDADD